VMIFATVGIIPGDGQCPKAWIKLTNKYTIHSILSLLAIALTFMNRFAASLPGPSSPAHRAALSRSWDCPLSLTGLPSLAHMTMELMTLELWLAQKAIIAKYEKNEYIKKWN
jgi:hypothetical protein